MNLVKRIYTYYLFFLFFLFPFMVAIDYYLIKYLVNHEVNDVLLHESDRIIYGLDKNKELPPSNYVYHITEIMAHDAYTEGFKDTLIYESYTDKYIPYRTYQFTALSGTIPLRISLRHILLEINELIFWLFATTASILLLMMVGLFFIHKRTFQWAWQPFFENLSQLKSYDITKKDPVHLKPSGISEFMELDEVVTALMEQVKKDFQNLKEFNENISHEIQTPLAIIRNKVVLLLESKNLDKKELQYVQAVYQEANKLSKISKSLTLISKIENQEFKHLESVDIKAIIDSIMSNMEEMITFKNLGINIELNPVKVECDQILANILFTNLIKNAVQHNENGGFIEMKLTKDMFEIINTGETSNVEPSLMFNRFQRGKPSTDSLGLGLAISQRICEVNGFRLNYERNIGKHKFSLFFKG